MLITGKLTPLQGDLKTITDENLEKLKKSILKYGFTAPGFVWKSGKTLYILDAHSRVKALDLLFAEGYIIPDIPIVYIKAKSKKEAKEKLLHISSQFGQFDRIGFDDFLFGANIEIDDLFIRLTDEEIEFQVPAFEPVGIEEQGQLDQLKPKLITCPFCGKEFDEREC